MQAAIPLMIAGAVASAGGQFIAGQQNASVLKTKAREEMLQGNAEQSRIRSAAREAMGRQVMAAAESGFAPGHGTALVELEESLINRELDILTSKRNASARAAGLKQQAKFAKREAAFGAVATLLQGAGAAAGHAQGMAAARA